jgi:hypothetical protein
MLRMDSEYQLRGGRQPDVAAIANVLAHHEVRGLGGEPLTEALVFAISGGIGAGYLLWEFAQDTSSALVLGFRGQWQDPHGWLKSTVDRLGLPAEVHTTGGKRGAAKRLTAELAEGNPVLVLPDRQLLGYWHLPKSAEGSGGHFVVAYAEEDGRVFLDDRNLASLTVERKTFDTARDRVSSYKNLLVSFKPGEVKDLHGAVRDGLIDCARRLSAASTSFSLPAWNRWSRQLTDGRSPKGWPTVFSGRRGLIGALLSVWETATTAGMTGGHLRDLFAEGLDEAAALLELPALGKQAEHWRGIAGKWDDLAATALSENTPEFAWMRGLTTVVSNGVRDGDAAQETAAAAGEELWRLRAHYDTEVPFTDSEVGKLYVNLSARLADLYAAELEGVHQLADTLGG